MTFSPDHTGMFSSFIFPIKNTRILQSKAKLPVPLNDCEGMVQYGEEEYPEGAVFNIRSKVYWKRISSAPHLQELLYETRN